MPSPNSEEERSEEILTPDVIQYCDDHYKEVMTALLERGLGDFIATDEDELQGMLERGQMDARLEATHAITVGALSLFGHEIILMSYGCPLCTFQNIVNHVSDNLVPRYRESN